MMPPPPDVGVLVGVAVGSAVVAVAEALEDPDESSAPPGMVTVAVTFPVVVADCELTEQAPMTMTRASNPPSNEVSRARLRLVALVALVALADRRLDRRRM